MNLPIEPVLFRDPQAARPLFFCPVCGGERYTRQGACPRCEGRKP